MNNTPFEQILKNFTAKISDYEDAKLTDEELYEQYSPLMFSSIVKIKTIENDLSDYNLELREFNCQLLDVEIELIALQMVCEWVSPFLYNTLLILPWVGTKEEKYYSQAAHIERLESLKRYAQKESQNLRKRYKYSHNAYIEEV